MSTGWAIALGIAVAVVAYAGVWFAMHDSWDPNPWGPALFGALLAGLIAFAIPMAISEDNDFHERCSAQGGHVEDDTQLVSTIGANGKPGMGVTTTSFCLSADGRILEIA